LGSPNIRLFGGLEIRVAGSAPAKLPTRKTALLIAALALAGEKGVRRAALGEAFWSDRGEAQSRGSLRQSLAAARRVFEYDGATLGIEGDQERLRLAGPPDAVDVWSFERLIAGTALNALAEAADLYQGDVLAGYALPDPLDQWFAPYRHDFRRKAIAIAEKLSVLPCDGEAARACQALAERLLSADAAAEEAHRALIRIYLARGQENAARRQLELCKEALQRELGAEPEVATAALLTAKVAPREAAPLAAGPPARDRERPSVIVLPFDNLSGEADEYFVDGVVEEITAALSRVRDFFVIARQSAFTYKGRFADVREIGRELGVNYIVEGTVRRGGDRLRISVQLVDAESRAQLWADRYEGATNDIFEFQDRIAAQVAGAIHPAVRKAEIDAARRKPPDSLRAYDLVLQAYPKIWSANPKENREAIALLTKAIGEAPHYGRAHALLAWCYSQEVVYLWSSDPEAIRARARAAVDATSGLIDDDPTALAAVGSALSQCLGDLDRAAALIEAALALDANNAWAWARYAWLAIYRDQPDAAKERFERSLTLSPLDPLGFNVRIGIAMALGLKGEYAQAARLMRDVLHKNPGVTWAHRQLAYVAALSGDLETARESVRLLRVAHPDASIALMQACHPSRHVPRVFGPMIEGWRLAGLPER
jgi:TolB-like protein/Tfp pilus assembly protein PilF